MKKKVLVIGGDSKMSQSLVPYLKTNNYIVISTTKRKKKMTKFKIFLDLSKVNKFVIPKNIDSAIFLAFMTRLQDCEENYQLAYKINGINIPNLIKKLISKNIFVCFVSSSIVFKNRNSLPKEDDRHCPISKYAMLKSLAEKKILDFAKKKKKKNCYLY